MGAYFANLAPSSDKQRREQGILAVGSWATAVGRRPYPVRVSLVCRPQGYPASCSTQQPYQTGPAAAAMGRWGGWGQSLLTQAKRASQGRTSGQDSEAQVLIVVAISAGRCMLRRARTERQPSRGYIGLGGQLRSLSRSLNPIHPPLQPSCNGPPPTCS